MVSLSCIYVYSSRCIIAVRVILVDDIYILSGLAVSFLSLDNSRLVISATDCWQLYPGSLSAVNIFIIYNHTVIAVCSVLFSNIYRSFVRQSSASLKDSVRSYSLHVFFFSDSPAKKSRFYKSVLDMNTPGKSFPSERARIFSTFQLGNDLGAESGCSVVACRIRLTECEIYIYI